MDTLILILRLVIAISVAFLASKLIGKLRLPGILGFLLTGMFLGPHALNIINKSLTQAYWYHVLSQILELSVGIMFARELIIKKLRSYGKQVLTITAFQSLGTFFIVSAVFAVIFYFSDIPLYLALLFGGIALATAPAPALSVINEFKTKGPVTSSLVPIAMIDDVIAIIVFFTINSFVASMGSSGSSSVLLIIGASILLPIVMGICIGFGAKFFYKKGMSKKRYTITTFMLIFITYGIGFITDNYILPAPSINYMMLGMATFTTIANNVPEHRMGKIASSTGPLAGIALAVMIMNLSTPLDYKLILGAGAFTAIYIITRGIGKYFGSYIGAKITNAPATVRKYLGLTLLPHSGVSLVFTGMAVASLSTFDSPSATIIQSTIAAAAVINEIFAVILAKKGFEMAGEIDAQKNTK